MAFSSAFFSAGVLATLAVSRPAEMAERKAAGSAKQHARRMREIAKQRRELEQRSERAAKLGERLQQLGVERALQGKGRRRRRASDEGTQRHYKWSQERKR